MSPGHPDAGGPFEAAVLCGGASSRMGRDKALIEIDGLPLAARVAEALRRAGAGSVLAVGGDAPSLTLLGLVVQADDHPGAGPLAATITALEATTSDIVLVVACDLLHPSPVAMAETVRALRRRQTACGAVPIIGGRRQWTHAAWRRDVLGELRESFAAGERSLRRAVRWRSLVDVVDLDPFALADADDPADLP